MRIVGWQNKVHSLALTALFVRFGCVRAGYVLPHCLLFFCVCVETHAVLLNECHAKSEESGFEKPVFKLESCSTWQMLLSLIHSSAARRLRENQVFIPNVHSGGDSMLTITA